MPKAHVSKNYTEGQWLACPDCHLPLEPKEHCPKHAKLGVEIKDSNDDLMTLGELITELQKYESHRLVRITIEPGVVDPAEHYDDGDLADTVLRTTSTLIVCKNSR